MAKITLGQISELIAQSNSGRITREMMRRFLGNPGLLQWQRDFYQEEFGLNVELGEDKIPTMPEGGKWRLIVVAKGLTIEGVFQKCLAKFGAWKYTDKDLDEVVTVNDRDPNRDGTYAIWVRDVVEADEGLKNLSATQLAAQGTKTETLLERLLHELAYFKATGSRLDIANWTLCAGSRISGGQVPRVDRSSDGGLNVSWHSPDHANGLLRAREAVSL